MTKRVWLVLLVSAFIFSGCGGAIYTVKKENVAVKLTTKKMGNAIKIAAEERGWVAKWVSNGLIHATYHSGRNMAKVAVKYTNTSYAISYLDSSASLKYTGKKIHRTYNKWVKNLERTIDRKLSDVSNGIALVNKSKPASLKSLGFKVGKTTKSDVMVKMGRPTSTSYDSTGQEVLIYNRSRLTGQAFNPFYYGRNRVKISYSSFTFKKNVLTAFSQSGN